MGRNVLRGRGVFGKAARFVHKPGWRRRITLLCEGIAGQAEKVVWPLFWSADRLEACAQPALAFSGQLSRFEETPYGVTPS